MAKKPLRSQLNQIRAWVRQGRTDAWIAHQLEVSASELREFRRRHELSPEEETGEVELRDEIEAEIEALADAEEEEAEEEEAVEGEAEESGDDEAAKGPSKREGESGGGRRRRRRRRRRGGGGDRPGASMQASFDHGDKDGYGLWLDPAVEDDPVYSEHWSGHRRVEVTIEPDRIVIKRS
jgi:hypothetical protein